MLGAGSIKPYASCSTRSRAPAPGKPQRAQASRRCPPEWPPCHPVHRLSSWRWLALPGSYRGKGFYCVGCLHFGGQLLLRVPAMGFRKEGASPALRSSPPLSSSQAIGPQGTAPWTQPPSRGGQRPGGPPALGSGPGPLEAYFSFPAPGSSLPLLGGLGGGEGGFSRAQDAGIKSTLSLNKRLVPAARSPGPPHSGVLRQFPPLPSPGACRLIIRF